MKARRCKYPRSSCLSFFPWHLCPLVHQISGAPCSHFYLFFSIHFRPSILRTKFEFRLALFLRRRLLYADDGPQRRTSGGCEMKSASDTCCGIILPFGVNRLNNRGRLGVDRVESESRDRRDRGKRTRKLIHNGGKPFTRGLTQCDKRGTRF